MGRAPLFTLLSSLFALVLIAAAALSPRQSFALGVRDWRSRLHAVGSDRRGLILVFSNLPFAREHRLTADAAAIPARQFQEIRDWLFESGALRGRRMGFWYANGPFPLASSSDGKFAAVLVPYWALIGITLLPPAFLLRRQLARRQRQRRGQCPACGYDLRHSPERCPECGATAGTSSIARELPERGFVGNLFLITTILIVSATIALMLAAGAAIHTPPPQTLTLPQTKPTSIRLDRVTRKAAVEAVARAAGLRVNVTWADWSIHYANELQSVSLHDPSALQVLDAIRLLMPGTVIRIDSKPPFGIICTPPSAPCVHEYPIGDLLPQVAETDFEIPGQLYPRSNFTDFVDHVSKDGQPVVVIGGKLFVVGSELPDQFVRALLAILREMRPPPGGKGYELAGALRLREWAPDVEASINEALSDPERNVVVAWEPVPGTGALPPDVAETTTRNGVTGFTPVYGTVELVSSIRRYDVHDLIERGAILAAKRYAHSAPSTDSDSKEEIRRNCSDLLIRTIKDLVYPDQWYDDGGSVAVVWDFRSSLVLSATTEIHRAIAQLLSSMRSAFSGPVEMVNLETVNPDPARRELVEIGFYDVRSLVDSVAEYRLRSPKPKPKPAPAPTEPIISGALFQNQNQKGWMGTPGEEALDEISTLIEDKINPDSWRDNGGPIGSIHGFGGLLIIAHTPATHRQIDHLLKELADPVKLEPLLKRRDQ